MCLICYLIFCNFLGFAKRQYLKSNIFHCLEGSIYATISFTIISLYQKKKERSPVQRCLSILADASQHFSFMRRFLVRYWVGSWIMKLKWVSCSKIARDLCQLMWQVFLGSHKCLKLQKALNKIRSDLVTLFNSYWGGLWRTLQLRSTAPAPVQTNYFWGTIKYKPKFQSKFTDRQIARKCQRIRVNW